MRGILRQLGLLACLAIALGGSTGAAPAEKTPAAALGSIMAAGNPGRAAFDRDFPDPSVIAAGGRYYAFATQTGWEPPGHVFPVLASQDLAAWRYAGDAFSAPPAWGRGSWWAPAVVLRGSTYYLYYSGLSRSGVHCVAVATAAAPAGPYADHGPIACQDGASAGYIDASPLIAGGKAYLYFSVDGPQHHSISVLPLSSDMLSAAGPRIELLGVTEGWEKNGNATVEGPSVFKWGSRYVMLYSGGDWRAQYGMGYALATSPLGPFVKSDKPLLRDGGSLAGPGGGSFFMDSSRRPWLAYHAWSGAARVLRITRLSISL